MIDGFKICINWRNRQELPDLSQAEILDMVADTVIEMTIENGKFARTLHDVMLKVFEKDQLSAEDTKYIRNLIIGNLEKKNARPVAEEKHQDRRIDTNRHDCQR